MTNNPNKTLDNGWDKLHTEKHAEMHGQYFVKPNGDFGKMHVTSATGDEGAPHTFHLAYVPKGQEGARPDDHPDDTPWGEVVLDTAWEAKSDDWDEAALEAMARVEDWVGSGLSPLFGRTMFKLWYPGIHGEGTLEDVVFDMIGRCFDTDHLRVPNEPDNPVIVKVDGRNLAVNEHSQQNSDYYEETGGLQKCNDITVAEYLGWLGDHLEIGELRYEDSCYNNHYTGSWLMVSISDANALKACIKFLHLVNVKEDRAELELKGYDICTTEAAELVDECYGALLGGGKKTTMEQHVNELGLFSSMEYIVCMLASHQCNDPEYVDGELMREFRDTTNCYEDIPNAISCLDAGLFVMHTENPKNVFSKGVFTPHEKAIAETIEDALREKLGNDFVNSNGVEVDISRLDGGFWRVVVIKEGYKVFSQPWELLVNMHASLPRIIDIAISKLKPNDDGDTPSQPA